VTKSDRLVTAVGCYNWVLSYKYERFLRKYMGSILFCETTCADA